MIPINEPLLNGNEKKYLNECIDTGWISSEGPFIKRFEESFAASIGTKNGIAICNGTAALETALYAIGIGKNDEVIMPSFTIVSCAIACIRLGAIPVLVDIEPDTWTMNVNTIEEKITSKTKAIMAVHIYGNSVDMDTIFKLAQKYGLKIIEDAAEVHGAEYYSKFNNGQWMKCGSMGDITSFSFYANKIITTGEGGMVLTNNDDYAERARSYRNLNFGDKERFLHKDIGYNFRMTNMQAAIGLAQVEQINTFLKIKIERGEYYREKFKNISEIKFHPIKPYAKCVYWMYCIELKPEAGINAAELCIALGKMGIGTRPFFKGLHEQPFMLNMGLFENEVYPNTEHAYKYGLYLPSGMTLTENQIDEVVDAIKKILNILE